MIPVLTEDEIRAVREQVRMALAAVGVPSARHVLLVIDPNPSSMRAFIITDIMQNAEELAGVLETAARALRGGGLAAEQTVAIRKPQPH